MPLYGAAKASLQLDSLTWTFPAGAKVRFSHLEHDKTVLDWQGAQIPFIGFDELTHFTSQQFWYLLSRNRSTCGVRPYVRATCNPDADSWVAALISWWLDAETGLAIPERSGALRWFVRPGEALVWADTPQELEHDYPGSQPKSLTFVPATLESNRVLMAADPGYRSNLMALPMVERERLLGGNWKVRPSAGMYFQRRWCQFVDAIPAGTRFVRGWDLAATPKTEHNDPDFTVAVKIGKCTDGRFIVVHHLKFRGAPMEVETAVLNTASQDGFECRIAIPQDGGQAGKDQAQRYARALAGYTVRTKPVTGDKATRFGAFSAQAEHGNVLILKGAWNEEFCSALEAFPEARHDDDADAASEAFNLLASEGALGWLEFFRQEAEKLAAPRQAELRHAEPVAASLIAAANGAGWVRLAETVPSPAQFIAISLDGETERQRLQWNAGVWLPDETWWRPAA